MSVTHVQKDTEARTMTITSRFDAPVDRVWQLWSDPRQLERWWGPPTWPATFVEHDLTPGGKVSYFMTGPKGERAPGWWQIRSIEAPRRLEFDDGFSRADGDRDPDMPVMVMRVSLAERRGGGTEMTIVTSFPTPEAMEQMLQMGMDEGMSAALGQIDAILAG
jgi:uncharacterized protein YndB with AHSA1/START domain